MPDARPTDTDRPTDPDPEAPSGQDPPAPEARPVDDEVVDGEVADIDDEEGEVVVEAEIVDDSPESAAEAVEVDMLAAIGQVEKQRDDYLEALQRLQADFENYKKRMMRQQTELLERSGFDLVEKLLPVLDAIDLARQHTPTADGGRGAAKALEQIASQLLDVLGKEGLERVDPVGEAFDPTEHEAVAHEPGGGDGEGEGDEPVAGPTVVALMRAGWRWRGRLVRPAMVTVKG